MSAVTNYSPNDRLLKRQSEILPCSLWWHSKTQYVAKMNKFERDLINVHLQQPRSFSFKG